MIRAMFLVIASLAAVAAKAEDNSINAIRDRVANAYNIDQLLAARTIKLEEDIREFYDSHDYTAEFHDLTRQRRHYILDLGGQRASSEYLTRIGEANYHGRSIVKDGEGVFIDYGVDTYEPLGEIDFDQHTGALYRRFDTLLAIDITRNADRLTHQGEAMWLGRMHDIIDLSLEGAPVQTLWIDKETGRISRMRREVNEQTTIHYTYDRPQEKNGIAFAREYSVYANDELLALSLNRNVEVNARADRNAFNIDKGVIEEPSRIDQDTMTVEEISLNVFHVGENGNYSTIFKGAKGLSVFSATPGLRDRIAAYRAEYGDDAPLRYVVISDHHRSDMVSAGDALDMGATLVVSAGAYQKLTAQFPDVEQELFKVVSSPTAIDGATVYALATTHAIEVLVPVSSDERIAAQALHYISPYEDAPFYAKHMAVTLYEALKAADLEPAILLSAGGRKIIPWTEFSEAVEAYDDTVCYRNRAICQEFYP